VIYVEEVRRMEQIGGGEGDEMLGFDTWAGI